MTEIPGIEFFGCKLFIDSEDPKHAEIIRDELTKMWKETYQKPEWYYRALAKERLQGVTG
jgi:hypothetical protein